jgi:hypothetical protein
MAESSATTRFRVAGGGGSCSALSRVKVYVTFSVPSVITTTLTCAFPPGSTATAPDRLPLSSRSVGRDVLRTSTCSVGREKMGRTCTSGVVNGRDAQYVSTEGLNPGRMSISGLRDSPDSSFSSSTLTLTSTLTSRSPPSYPQRITRDVEFAQPAGLPEMLASSKRVCWVGIVVYSPRAGSNTI